jgi:hypothetical protein
MPPGLHVKTPSGRLETAVKLAVCPLQIVALFTVSTGLGFTVTIPIA